jgi:hypothetical protein
VSRAVSITPMDLNGPWTLLTTVESVELCVCVSRGRRGVRGLEDTEHIRNYIYIGTTSNSHRAEEVLEGHFGAGHFGAGHFGAGHFGAGHFSDGHYCCWALLLLDTLVGMKRNESTSSSK